MNYELNIPNLNLGNYSTIFLIANAIAIICTILVILSIIMDFVQYHRPQKSKKKKNSWVETGSMFVYFFIYVYLMKLSAGRINFESELVTGIIQIFGTIFILAGCYVNIKGRIVLKSNWANQATIYHNHKLITKSVYNWVRHPLYASLIWMFIGGSLIYCSYFALISVSLIFIPMMFYRGKQEESLLQSEFPEYSQYKQRVGMFFPKLF